MNLHYTSWQWIQCSNCHMTKWSLLYVLNCLLHSITSSSSMRISTQQFPSAPFLVSCKFRNLSVSYYTVYYCLRLAIFLISAEDTDQPSDGLRLFFSVPFIRVLNRVFVFGCYWTLSWYFNLQHNICGDSLCLVCNWTQHQFCCPPQMWGTWPLWTGRREILNFIL